MIRRYSLAAVAWLLIASQLFAATVRWTGAAQDVRGTWTITVAGTWATGDTATLTINNKSLTVTVGSATSTSNVADILARAVDAATDSADLLGNETRNFGGEQIAEFAELDASASGAVLTITTEVAGVSLTASSGSVALTRSEVTAGDGALGAVTAVVAATGKNWLSNAANYSGGSVPIDNDTLIFDSGDVDVLYALDHFRTGSIDLNVEFTNDYTGQVGLPIENALDYREYRSRYWQYRGVSKWLLFTPGSGAGGTAQGNCWVDLQDQTGVSIVVFAGRGTGTTPTIFLAGADATTLTNDLRVHKGAVYIEPDDAPTGTTKYASFAEIDLGETGGALADTTVIFGRNVRMVSSGTSAIPMNINSGLVQLYTHTTDATNTRTTNVFAGRLELRIPAIVGTNTNYRFNVYSGGSIYPYTQVGIDRVTLYGGRYDTRYCVAEGGVIDGIPTIKAYKGSAIYDPNGMGVETIDFIGCRESDMTESVLPINRQFDISAAATP